MKDIKRSKIEMLEFPLYPFFQNTETFVSIEHLGDRHSILRYSSYVEFEYENIKYLSILKMEDTSREHRFTIDEIINFNNQFKEMAEKIKLNAKPCFATIEKDGYEIVQYRILEKEASNE